MSDRDVGANEEDDGANDDVDHDAIPQCLYLGENDEE